MKRKTILAIIVVALVALVSCDPKEHFDPVYRSFRGVENRTSQPIRIVCETDLWGGGNAGEGDVTNTKRWYDRVVEIGECCITPCGATFYAADMKHTPLSYKTILTSCPFRAGYQSNRVLVCDEQGGNILFEFTQDVWGDETLWPESSFREVTPLPLQGDYLQNIQPLDNSICVDDDSGYHIYYYLTMTLTDEMLAEWAEQNKEL